MVAGKYGYYWECHDGTVSMDLEAIWEISALLSLSAVPALPTANSLQSAESNYCRIRIGTFFVLPSPIAPGGVI
jgi:hypothetical protein